MYEVGITNREVIAGFRDLIADKTQISDDSGWSKRLIYYHLLRYRARLIREKVIKRMPLSRWNYQTIDCIPLSKANIDECPCTPATGCVFLKTVTRIPKPLDNLKSVTSTDGHIIYTYAEWDKLQYKLKSRFAGEKNAAYYTLKTKQDGTYLYLYNDVHKKYVTITGIFENPMEVQYYPDCNGNVEECKTPLDKEFILDPDMLTTMYDLAFAQMARGKQMYTDVNSDDMDNIAAPAVKPQRKSE